MNVLMCWIAHWQYTSVGVKDNSIKLFYQLLFLTLSFQMHGFECKIKYGLISYKNEMSIVDARNCTNVIT